MSTHRTDGDLGGGDASSSSTSANAAGSSSLPQSTSEDSHSLFSSIFLTGVYGVNLGPAVPRTDVSTLARRCVKPWDKRTDSSTWTESLEGGNLIISIPFNQPVRLSSILINQGVGEQAVTRIRAYINRPSGLSFDDIIDTPPGSSTSTGLPSSGLPQADFLLRPQDATVMSPEERIQEYPLGRFAPRFKQVTSIHLVLSDAATAPAEVFYLCFRGVAPRDPPNRDDLISVHAEDAATTPMGRVRQSAPGAASGIASSRGSAADGTGGQAR